MLGLIGCWEWMGTKNTGGYGMMGFRGKRHLAHRLAYEFKIGPVPTGMDLLHKCDNIVCVNPAHLVPGTAKDNIIDSINKGRWNRKGENNVGAKLSARDVYAIRLSTMKVSELAAKFNVSATTINNIKNRKRWGHLPDNVVINKMDKGASC